MKSTSAYDFYVLLAEGMVVCCGESNEDDCRSVCYGGLGKVMCLFFVIYYEATMRFTSSSIYVSTNFVDSRQLCRLEYSLLTLLINRHFADLLFIASLSLSLWSHGH